MSVSINFLKEGDDLVSKKDSLIEDLYHDGRFFLNMGEYYQAIEYFNKVLKIDPENEDAWYYKGLAYFDSNEYQDAIKCFDKVIELNQDDDSAWYYKAVSLFELERYGESIPCFDKVISLDPDDRYSYYYKGLALSCVNKYKEAFECYTKLVELIGPLYKPRYYYINDFENKMLEDFAKHHQHEDKMKGSIPEAPYHIRIIPNSVGYIAHVICDVCAKEKKNFKDFFRDITDYKCW